MNASVASIDTALDALQRSEAELELNRLGCVLVAASCGRYAELIHRPKVDACGACRAGFHGDPAAGCGCPCHQEAVHA